ncbi:MAG: aminoglycoside phosphotransferase family protein [Planctomycetota bacterium]
MDQPDTPEHCTGLGRAPAPPPAESPAQANNAEPAPCEPVEVLPRSPSPAPHPEDTKIAPFGAALAPVLLDLCEGRLAGINWFRTDWQRGGALTGYATWRDEQGEHPVVVKLPIPPRERRWLVQLSPDDVTPRVLAHGSELGGYDLAWAVMERLPYGPLGTAWGAQAYELVADAAANFYARARLIPMGDPLAKRDWAGLLKRSKQSISKDTIEHSQRWRKALKAASKRLPGWLEVWYARDTGFWCHGDLHPGNAMTRVASPDGPAVLFDLACVHPGHWVEDAVYLEHLYWASPKSLHGTKPVKLIAHHLRDYGLAPGSNWPDLANIYRGLLAMTAPAQRHAMLGTAHTAAALKVLERLV